MFARITAPSSTLDNIILIVQMHMLLQKPRVICDIIINAIFNVTLQFLSTVLQLMPFTICFVLESSTATTDGTHERPVLTVDP